MFVTNSYLLLQGQTMPFDKNIILEETNGGAMVFDIQYANNKLFVYSSTKLLVYDNEGVSLLQTLELTNLGKFAPNFFDSRVWVPDTKLMAYNSTDNVLYVVRTDMKIEAFGFNEENSTYYSMGIIVETPAEIHDIKTLHGFTILKYDEVNQRLFWVVQGRSADDNSTGTFHVRETYFAIYKEVFVGQDLNLNIVHNEFYVHNIDEEYINAIYDIELIDDGSEYYLARIRRIDIFSITEVVGETNISPVGSISTPEGKIGKLLYINEINKVIAFPYRLPFQDGVWEPDSSNYAINFYVIDVYNHEAETIASPDRRIIDAVYLPDNDDLILCRNPVNDIYNTAVGEQDIAIYHWNGSTFTYDTENYLINTNGFQTNVNPNTPTRMIPVGNNGIIISKTHEIVHLYKNFGGNNYSFEQKHSGINNFFFLSTQGNNNTFIINLVNNGIVKLNPFTFESTTRTGFPAFHIVQNEQHGKLYFFNKLNSNNTGVYMHDIASGQTININELNIVEEQISNPIGDVVYSSFTNQILVSENAVNGSSIGVKCYNGTTGKYESSITIPTGYCKKMFISPNGLLYVTAGMYYEYNQVPHIYIFDIVNNYQLLNGPNGEDVNIPPTLLSFRYYSANFCYNPYNHAVYATFSPQELVASPYTSSSESNEILNIDSNPLTYPNGILLKLTDVILHEYMDLDYPSEIICREPLVGSGGNMNGYLFINQQNKLSIFDCDDNTIIVDVVRTLSDITYSTKYDKLFGIVNYTMENDGTGTKVYEIDSEGNDEEIYSLSGIVSSCFINPFDNMLYLYHRFDDKMLGELITSLVKIDPENPGNPQIIELGDDENNKRFNGFFPEILQKSQTPAISAYNNKIYLPNGGHSSVSVVNFDANETMTLNPGSNWISIPRHSGNVTPGTYDPWPTSLVFHKDNFETPYSSLKLAYNNTQATPETEVYATYNIDIEDFWYYEDDMYDTYSYRGYKLDYFESSSNTISLTGNVEDPNTTMHLYEDKENWIGYFLYEKQDIFDAIADIEDQLYMIKGQDYFCFRGDHDGSGGVPQPFEPWICDKLSRNIDYGEMVVLKSYYDIPAFQWNYSGNPPNIVVDEELEYYSYTETSDYSAFIIELDSTENPVEMGAFVNDSCIGACTLTPEDTLVIIKGYLGSQPGDSVVFEEYFTQKATNNKRIVDYFVYNSQRKVNEKRVIKTGENKDMYFISFKPGDEQKLTEFEYSFSIFPNPTNNLLNINYSVENTTKVNISVFDSFGRHIATLFNSNQPLGSYGFQWNLSGNNGNKVPKGLYIIKFKINDVVVSKKVVVN
ncbi:MAG: T9SS type A sorting domain-containing protein [Bacteroidota bacterium]